MYREVHAGRRRVLGDEHPYTLITATNLAGCLGKQEKWAEAEPILREVYAAFKKTLGLEHPHTLMAANELVRTSSLLFIDPC